MARKGDSENRQKFRNNPASAEEAVNKRRLRNRLSQQAFRERQAIYIKELEKKLDSTSKPEDERVSELVRANQLLRDRLLDCHKKLGSLQAALKGLSDSVTDTLHGETSDGTRPTNTPHTQSEDMEAVHDMIDDFEYGCPDEYVQLGRDLLNLPDDADLVEPAFLTNIDYLIPEEDRHLPDDSIKQAQSSSKHRCSHAIQPIFAKPSCPPISIPQSPSTGLVTSGAAYATALAGGQFNQMKDRVWRSNSLFSDHIMTVEKYLRLKWIDSGAAVFHNPGSMTSSISFMLSTFLSFAWPAMSAWYTYTRAHVHVTRLMAWHLNPNLSTYNNLTPRFRPTHVQMAVPHPAILDWVPFPTIRDKLILYHSANPQLDGIICDIGSSFVVEADASTLVAGAGPRAVYVSIWDLVAAIEPSDAQYSTSHPQHLQSWPRTTCFNSAPDPTPTEFIATSVLDPIGPAVTLPAPSVRALFESREYAFLAFKALGMDNGEVTWRVDPAFFDRHPELAETKAGTVAHGSPLKPQTPRKIAPMPGPLSPKVIQRYSDLVQWTFDSVVGAGPE